MNYIAKYIRRVLAFKENVLSLKMAEITRNNHSHVMRVKMFNELLCKVRSCFMVCN